MTDETCDRSAAARMSGKYATRRGRVTCWPCYALALALLVTPVFAESTFPPVAGSFAPKNNPTMTGTVYAPNVLTVGDYAGSIGNAVGTFYRRFMSLSDIVLNTVGWTRHNGVVSSAELYVEPPTEAADAGAGRFVSRAWGAQHGYPAWTVRGDIRASEFQVFRETSTSGLTWGVEIGVHSLQAGNTSDQVVGASIYSTSKDDYPTTPGARADTGVYVWGNNGWSNGYLYRGTDGAELYRIDQSGISYGRRGYYGPVTGSAPASELEVVGTATLHGSSAKNPYKALTFGRSAATEYGVYIAAGAGQYAYIAQPGDYVTRGQAFVFADSLGGNGVRIAAGSLAVPRTVGFNGAPPIGKATLPAALPTDGSASNVAMATMLNAIRTTLINVGLAQ